MPSTFLPKKEVYMNGKPNKALVAFSFFFCLCTGLCAQAPDAGVLVTLDHPEWTYRFGQKARFSVTVLQNGRATKNARIHIEIGQEKMQPAISLDTLLKNGRLVMDGGTMNRAGFLRCTAAAEIGGKTYRGMATAAFSPDSIVATAEQPQDFAGYWTTVIREARKISLSPRMTLLPARSAGAINVYEVSFQSFRPGARLYGILCVPKKEGRYPAILKVPGAGVRAYRGDTALAEKGVVTFEIGIHGLPVTLPNEVYYNLAAGALHEYYFSNLEDKDRYYYKRVYAGSVRAVDFLLSLPQVDSTRLAVYGGSQGGALAIVTAALQEKVGYVAALYPALSDLTGYLHGRAGGWPHMFGPLQQAAYGKPQMLQTAAYYDVANFARLLKVPGWYSWGFNDEVCPPTTAYAVFNAIRAPKDLFIAKESGHWLTPAQAEEANRWLLKMLRVNP